MARGRLRLRPRRRLPAGVAGADDPRRQHGRPALHGGREVSEAPAAAPAAAAR